MNQQKVKILLIEDDEDDYILFKNTLRKTGIPHEIQWDCTYEGGLDCLENKIFDICFVDYRLGKHTGLELLKQMKKKRLWRPIILLTGQGNEELGLRAIQEGAEDYLMKSEITPNILRRSIRYTLERSRLRQREEKLLNEEILQKTTELAMLTDMVPVGIGISQDAKCNKIFPNKELAGMFKIDTNQNASITTLDEEKPPYKIFIDGKEATGKELPMHIAAETGKTLKDIEFELLYPDGTSTTISGSGSPLFDENNKIRGSVGVFIDITDRKDLDKRKDEFIGIASHELKTPLTSMKTFVQILEKRLQQKGDKKDTYILENVTKQVNRLTNLINDLLNVNTISDGKLKLNKTWVDLDTLIKKIIIAYQYSTDTHQIVAEGKIGKKVYIDEHRIEQVLTNLINNAIKYSPNADKIIIHVSSDKNYATVSVQDFGLGIERKDQVKVFERFYRAKDEENATISGFGLGLYISSEIVKRHGGKIWVKSSYKKGSTFHFSLPLTSQES
jgi:signal transduction histidine kinase/CheY-like chemotaxis protein